MAGIPVASRGLRAPSRARCPRRSRRPRAARRRARSRRSSAARAAIPSSRASDLAQLAAVAGREDPDRATLTARARSSASRCRANRVWIPCHRQLHERRVLLGRERALLGGGLDLDEPAVAGHHEVAVDLGLGVLDVRQVDAGLAVDDPGRDRGHRLAQRVLHVLALAFASLLPSLPAARRRRTARASATQPPVIDAVRVPPSAWITSQSMVICRGPSARVSTAARKRSSDEPLDLLTAPTRTAAGPGVRRARQHRVLGGHPAPPLPLQERRHLLLDRGGADDLRLAEAISAEPFGVSVAVGGDHDRAQLVRSPSVGSHGARLYARRLRFVHDPQRLDAPVPTTHTCRPWRRRNATQLSASMGAQPTTR